MLLVALAGPVDLFAPPYALRALLCVVALAFISAAVGWAIVLRDLPFFTHAVGSGAYPVLVVGVLAGVGIATASIAGTIIFAAAFAVFAGIGTRRDALRSVGVRDAHVGLAVVAALASGSVIAATAGSGRSDVNVSPETLLFGSVLTADATVLALLAATAVVVSAGSWAMFERWLAAGFDPATRPGGRRGDLLLYAAVALAAGATLPVTGALLTGAMLIAPAATARMLTDQARRLPPLTLLIALIVGAAGLWLSLAADLPAGPSIAAVAGGVFFVVAAGRSLALQGLRSAPAPAFGIAVVCILALTGCGSQSQGTGDDDTLKIVASTPQVADIVRNVASEAATVSTLMPPGADPHSFEPKPSAVAALGEADVIFVSGGSVDAWAAQAIRASGSDRPAVDLSRAVVLIAGGSHEHDHEQDGHVVAPHGGDDADRAGRSGAFNAHWYLAPDNIARATKRVRDELVKADPPARESYRAGADAYLEEISATARRLHRCTAGLPAADRRLISGHDDFNYLADAFDFTIVAQIAESGEAEPSARSLEQSVSRARQQRARAVIASSGEVSRLQQQVAEKLNLPLLQLYADNLTTGDDASTLLDAVDYDVSRITGAVSDGAVDCGER